MRKVFFDTGISLDGYMAGENRGPDNPLGDGGLSIHDWMFRQKAFLNIHGIEGGEDGGTDGRVIENTLSRTGSCIKGCSHPGWGPDHTTIPEGRFGG